MCKDLLILTYFHLQILESDAQKLQSIAEDNDYLNFCMECEETSALTVSCCCKIFKLWLLFYSGLPGGFLSNRPCQCVSVSLCVSVSKYLCKHLVRLLISFPNFLHEVRAP